MPYTDSLSFNSGVLLPRHRDLTIMLSHQQYLHPDYLQPLPTTLDAKKSPLALLAQTCSAIGKDPAPAKTSSSEKKEGRDGRESSGSKSESPRAKSSSPDNIKTERSSGSSDKRDNASPMSDKSGFRAPAPKDIPPLVPIPGSGDRSPAPHSSDSSKEGRERDESGRSSRGPSPSTPSVSNSRLSLSTAMLLDSAHASDLSRSSPHSGASALPASLKPEHLGASLPHSLYPGCGLPYLGQPLPGMDHGSTVLPPSTLSAHSAMALASHHKYSMAGHMPTSAISPYTYARVKTTAGATTLVPICRDPYCTNCQITMQSAQLGSACAAGCTQCNHDKSPFNGLSSSLGGLPSTVPVMSLPGAGGLPATAHLSSLYGHAFGVLPGHPSLPYVCNWMAGSDYCGKRFSSSEELLQHLRTHTSSSDAAALSGLSGYPGLSGLSPAALAACHNPHYPISLSPNSLRQAYPRSLSPSSLLAARYHPYKSPLSVLPPPTGLSGLPAGLHPYYSHYALYGQRLGAAVAP